MLYYIILCYVILYILYYIMLYEMIGYYITVVTSWGVNGYVLQEFMWNDNFQGTVLR